MNFFTVDPRDAFSSNGRGCNACCCGQASARPGETNKWSINYAPWSGPLGGRGLTDRTDFSLELQRQSVDSRAPINTNKYFPGIFNTPIVGDLSVGAVDPLEGDLTYFEYQLTQPEFGEVVINEDGTFTYTANIGHVGYDTFYYFTRNSAKQVVRQVIVGVAAADADPLVAKAFDKPLYLMQRSLRVDKDLHMISFALAASPIANIGEIYRMDVKQRALDCACEEYTHISCYDITIENC